ncbi:FAD-dependent oxidoreductase [Stella sp.]|uniref:FAD-dependent oxidoreductase n=1 Tax=Stella sp. TaxID=2912054 RepID=UPI0035AEA493
MTIAILGAGILGTCAALAIADRGGRVVLVERNDQPIAEASLHNEGKLHLGFTYAADPTPHTVRTMQAGAARFLDVLGRWVPADALDRLCSRPFDYVVLDDSQVPAAAVERHFARVADAWRQASRAAARPPAAADRPFWRPLAPAERDAHYDGGRVVAAYETAEIAIDPRGLAPLLRRAVAGHPRIEWLGGTRITGIEPQGEGHAVLVEGPAGPARIGPFAAVVNALWANRPWLDRMLGIDQPGPWFIRFKAGVRVAGPPPDGLRSVTALLGPYGDVVVQSDGRTYLSWYPDCMIGSSRSAEPADWAPRAAGLDRDGIARRTIAAMAAIQPAARRFLTCPAAAVEVSGGAIYALAVSDIDDRASRLHRRDVVGIRSHGSFHSVDTSKFTLGPALAVDVADRVRPP